MSQRDSGYARIERDAYETPEWVTDVLAGHLDKGIMIWEPACGSGKMVAALRKHQFPVQPDDITQGKDFLLARKRDHVDAIITNPPYNIAQEFIEHALDLMQPSGLVAMLLRTDYDHAKTRQHLFGEHRAFWRKVVLTKRIQWFAEAKASPSFNHAWFIWDWKHFGTPTLAYGP